MKKTVGKQIWLLVFSAMILISGIIATGIYSLNQISTISHRLYNHPYTVSNAVRDVKIRILSIHRSMKDISQAETPSAVEKYSKQVIETEKEMFASIEIIKKAFLGDKKKIDELEQALIKWRDIRNEVIGLTMIGEAKAAFKITKEQGMAHVDSISKQTQWLLQFANNKGKEFIMNSDKFQRKTLFTFVGASLIAVFILSLFSWMIVKKIKHNLTVAGKQLNSQSNGLEGNILKLSKVGENLLDASQKQSNYLSSTVEAVTELQATASNTSEKSNQASDISTKTKEIAGLGKESLRALTNAIHDIQKANTNVVETVLKNNSDVGNIVNMIQEISEKTQIINDIVFQTKLLSFNASVEAARAGEHGKGFSVVAEEIGNLANMSGVAATEINQMLELRTNEIENLVSKSSKVIEELVQSSKKTIQTGIDLSGECQQKFEQVTTNSGKLNGIVFEVSSMTDEQLSAIKLIQKDMSELNTLGQKYKSSSQDTHSMSKDLLSGQKELCGVIGRLNSMIDKKAA